MKYSRNFIKKVKNEYPDWEYLHELLDKNDKSIGDYLVHDLKSHYVYPHMIIQSNNLNELKEMALKYLRREEIYLEWLLYDI